MWNPRSLAPILCGLGIGGIGLGGLPEGLACTGGDFGICSGRLLEASLKRSRSIGLLLLACLGTPCICRAAGLSSELQLIASLGGERWRLGAGLLTLRSNGRFPCNGQWPLERWLECREEVCMVGFERSCPNFFEVLLGEKTSREDRGLPKVQLNGEGGNTLDGHLSQSFLLGLKEGRPVIRQGQKSLNRFGREYAHDLGKLLEASLVSVSFMLAPPR